MKKVSTILGIMLVSSTIFAAELNSVCNGMLQSSLAARSEINNALESGQISTEDRQMHFEDEKTVIRIQARSCALSYKSDQRTEVMRSFLSAYTEATK